MVNNVVIIDSDISFSQRIKKQINNSINLSCDTTFFSLEEFLQTLVTPTDLIFIGIEKKDLFQYNYITFILNKYPNSKIIIHTSDYDLFMIEKSFELGVVGFIDKLNFNGNIQELLDTVSAYGVYISPAIAKVITDSFKRFKIPNLTDREHEVVQGILEGYTYLQVAQKYFITIDTVRSHIKNIYKKLNINSKAQLFKIYRK
jgi:DNA-binding NarL/FixJ family response regulator